MQQADSSELTSRSLVGQGEYSEDTYSRPKRNFDSTCCSFWLRDSESQVMTFQEILQKLFNLCPPDTQEACELFFFDSISKKHFLDILKQISLCTKDQEYEQFTDLIKNFDENWFFNPKKFEEQYDLQNVEHGNQSSQFSHGSRYLDMEWTHQLIWNFFRKLKELRLITVEKLGHFLYFREVTYDTFCLFDYDNDEYLRAISVDHEGSWEDGDLDDNFFEDLNEKAYKHYSKSFFKCFRQIRVKNLRKKFYRQNKESKLQKLIHSVKEFIHIIDTVTDVQFAWQLYFLSQEEQTNDDKGVKYDYKICFILTTLTILCPYIIQYSSYLSHLQSIEAYSYNKLRASSMCKRVFLWLQMTFIGVIFVFLLDFSLKFLVILKACLYPLNLFKIRGVPVDQFVTDRIQNLIQDAFQVKNYDIHNFKLQNKMAQLIFEDLVMLFIVDMLVITQVLSVPKVLKESFLESALIWQLMSTLASISLTHRQLVKESKCLNEGYLDYLLICLKAKQGWTPYGIQIREKKLYKNLKYDQIELKSNNKLVGTDDHGKYDKLNFQFSNATLKLHSNLVLESQISDQERNLDHKIHQFEQDELEVEKNKAKLIQEQNRNQGGNISDAMVVNSGANQQELHQEAMKRAKSKFEIYSHIINSKPTFFYGKSLSQISLHAFLNYIDSIQSLDHPLDKSDFIFAEVDFDLMIKNSEKEGLMSNEIPKTQYGKPLLQVCIENQTMNRLRMNLLHLRVERPWNQNFRVKWPLRRLMRTLLYKHNFNPHILCAQDKLFLLEISIQGNHYEAAKMILSYCMKQKHHAFQYQDGTTLFGYTLKLSIKYRIKNLLLEFANILNNKDQANQKITQLIDIHKSQIRNEQGKLVTPIVYLIEYKYKFNLSETFFNEIIETNYFTQTTFQLKLREEINQIYQLSVQNKDLEKFCYEFVQNNTQSKDLKEFYKDLAKQFVQYELSMEKDELKKDNSKEIKIYQIEYEPQIDSKIEKRQINVCFLSILLSFFIEQSSFIDFISDLYIIYQLANSQHTAWLTISLLTVLAPYLTVYTSLINYQIMHIQRIKPKNRTSKNICKSCMMILPTMLVFVIFIDFSMICLAVIAGPILMTLAFTNVGQQMVQKYDHFQNYFMRKLFGLSRMEIQGFRSQRIILQFQLESVPQIFFQSYLLIRLNQLERTDDAKKLGVSYSSILFSIVCAIIHVIFELISLYIESQTSQTPFYQYLIACCNAKEGWMPRQIEFQNQLFHEKSTVSKEVYIDRGGLFMGGHFGYTIGFEFTNQNISIILQLISNMSIQQDEQLKVLHVDKSFQNINLENLIKLVQLSRNKIKLQFSSKFLESLLKQIKSDQITMLMLQKPNQISKKSQVEQILIQIIQSKEKELIKIMIEITADFSVKSNLNGKTAIQILFKYFLDHPDLDLFTQFYDNRKDLNVENEFKLCMIHNLGQIINNSFNESQDEKMQINIIINFIVPFLFDPLELITFEQKQILIKLIDKSVNLQFELVAQLIIYALWGASPLIHQSITFEIPVETNKKIQQWQSTYPKLVKINDGENYIEFDSKFLCNFVIFRKIFFEAFIERFDPQDFPSKINIKNIKQLQGISISDLDKVSDILQNKGNTLNLLELSKLDELVTQIGLDNSKALYVEKSRQLLPEPHLNHVTQIQEIEPGSERKICQLQIPKNAMGVKQLQLLVDKPSDKKCIMYTWTKTQNQLESLHINVIPINKSNDGMFLIPITLNQNEDESQFLNRQHQQQYNLLSEIVMNDYCNGHIIELISIRRYPEKIQIKAKLEYYKKIQNGQFVEINNE